MKSDTDHRDYSAKVPSDDALYKAKVAEPAMNAVDQMPPVWRDLVHQYGYVDVYRAWKRDVSPAEVRRAAEAAGGFFTL